MKSYNAECTADYSTGYTCKAQTNCQSSLKIARDVIENEEERERKASSFVRETSSSSTSCFNLFASE
jgi:hypothetical protein